MGFIRGQNTAHTFLENLISKYDTGPVKLTGSFEKRAPGPSDFYKINALVLGKTSLIHMSGRFIPKVLHGVVLVNSIVVENLCSTVMF